MRTTLNIDDDLLAAAKELARCERCSVGRIVSRLLRHSLMSAQSPGSEAVSRRRAVAGFKPFPARPGAIVTDEVVNALRETEGI